MPGMQNYNMNHEKCKYENGGALGLDPYLSVRGFLPRLRPSIFRRPIESSRCSGRSMVLLRMRPLVAGYSQLRNNTTALNDNESMVGPVGVEPTLRFLSLIKSQVHNRSVTVPKF